jgi:hypothetical protein
MHTISASLPIGAPPRKPGLRIGPKGELAEDPAQQEVIGRIIDPRAAVDRSSAASEVRIPSPVPRKTQKYGPQGFSRDDRERLR